MGLGLENCSEVSTFSRALRTRSKYSRGCNKHLQHLGRRRLLLPRFAQFARARFELILQPCWGEAVNASSRLRCLRTKTGNASTALRSFGRQDHLVGHRVPFWSGPAKIEPVNPNRTAR